MEIDKELIRGQTDLIILAMLAGGDLYGYELAKRIKQQTDGAFELKEGTLYLVFKRLEKAGLVESYWGEGEVGARRKYYRLCSRGQHHLESLTSQWQLMTKVVQGCLDQAATAGQGNPDTSTHLASPGQSQTKEPK